MLTFYRRPAASAAKLRQLQDEANARVADASSHISRIESEFAYYVELKAAALSDAGESLLASETLRSRVIADCVDCKSLKHFCPPPPDSPCAETASLRWLLSETFEADQFASVSFIAKVSI
jgi:hypothetical protein